MKEDRQKVEVPAAAVRECHFKRFSFVILCCLVGWFAQAQKQCLDLNVFAKGEQMEYDLYFKWGLLMPKAGTASMTIKDTNYKNTPAWHTFLLLNTSGMVDKVFSIRDTMQNFISKENPRLLYSGKRSYEGGYYEMDDLNYTYKDNKAHIHAVRKNLSRVRADTVLVAGECVLDLLGSFMFARSFDWTNIEVGVQYPLEVGMGKSLINVAYRYAGQRIIERGNVKYRTRLIIIDIYDDAFTESKEAMELWIGDDDNHLPIKMRAKLKIGAMEAYYKSSKNLRYPLNCRVEIP
ncbi:hypothetical protein M2459_002701 [Parabacteroides sp. PF5-5]|uniref:DUF3108 domain-containing protein n=1 Tax=unclassified Parabacteroides TaxID=2649774 RepID=UPI0024750ACE|nr:MULTISPECIES: DUF3108 domain-containing protein [unclassified Parabacteroides]MDH6305914.1 hypothetical protein [Parabacteroides sp. PH5-39]MDH6316871.1 hypothetical protein [Parabacteroides sp. PF5-13]MDH6320626.1 hypothetical protein [Parabacteroides sp. PH5-13]MDH6324453.1 hypothetical protein [Parabacteroides sp. PH5-8]MDH6328056.1 hypothetical protein [Parabacteroides sp. PH5-41]